MYKKTVDSVFKEWIEFMQANGPMGKLGHLSTSDFLELRNKIRAELDQLDQDDENFFMGGSMS